MRRRMQDKYTMPRRIQTQKGPPFVWRAKENFIVGKKRLHYCRYSIIIKIPAKKGGYMPQRKPGRPVAENPKNIRLDIRVTKDELRILDEYCARKKVKRPQGLRDGIKALEKM